MTLWIALFVTMQAQTGAEATLARADSLKDQGRMEEALTRYREFVDDHPNDFEGQRRLGGALLEAGRVADAAPSLRRAVELQPRSAAAHYSLGYGLLQLGDFAQAQDHFKQALAIDANYATAQYGLGLALWAGGQHERSGPHVSRRASAGGRRAPKRTTTSARCSSEVAISTLRSRRTQKSTEIDPSYADANLALGLIHAKRGEQAQAIDRFRRVLRSKPDSTPARTQLAWLLATSSNASPKDHRAALALAEQLVTSASDPDAGALDVLAAALAANGQFDRAANTAERMLVVLGSDGPIRARSRRLAIVSLYIVRERRMSSAARP